MVGQNAKPVIGMMHFVVSISAVSTAYGLHPTYQQSLECQHFIGMTGISENDSDSFQQSCDLGSCSEYDDFARKSAFNADPARNPTLYIGQFSPRAVRYR
jgi:hypothetical protein